MITCNGAPVLELALRLPPLGCWVAELEVDTDDLVEGAIVLEDAARNRYSGTVIRSGVVAGSCRLEAVGGTGGLAQSCTARSFQGVTAKAVIADTLAQVGERLDPSSTPTVLNTRFQYWTRAAGRAGTALSVITDALGATVAWRVLPNGAVWVGEDRWLELRLPQDVPELDRDGAAGTVELAADDLALVPGCALQGRRVGRVEHRLSRDAPLRTRFWIAE